LLIATGHVSRPLCHALCQVTQSTQVEESARSGYNFVKLHKAHKLTPAMAAGVWKEVA
jgi:hypothetical protein